ncbi:MAG: hypothetical protein QHH15_02630 [Candidatus Thermoplasmatota archaeon]|jgi:hypothetical protein|nr:hypothetical protein [Candidatus Thermoplasmatota archaeon]
MVKRNNYGISEMFGTVLLLSIAVSSFVIVHANLLLNPFSQDRPFTTVVGWKQGENITLLHRGGEPLSLKTKVTFEIGNNSFNIVIGNYLDSESKYDGEWNIGEILIYNPPGFDDLADVDVKVTVFDVETNTIIMSEQL